MLRKIYDLISRGKVDEIGLITLLTRKGFEIKFCGKLLGHVAARDERYTCTACNTPIEVETVYQVFFSDDRQYIAAFKKVSQHRHYANVTDAKVCNVIEDVIDYFGGDHMAMMLYESMGLSVKDVQVYIENKEAKAIP